MSLLKLSNIGKIYVSGESVAVGIRGVDLEFDIGEFVAITGKSGSGKTTLLNVISGMDTFEEGELYIEGEPTSHYDQSDWEDYRQKYISFIFQDYNIIESFTVLQNVELALSDSYSPSERRKRALELIDRVGLTKFKKHKGSKLSGGQKQRTVIARALAKDSPIILADEPTGNLDSATSKEIVDLLHEISKDKLVIVVTHNFDELRDCATREVRIFDGAVERDEQLRHADKKEYKAPSEKKIREHSLRKGAELAWCRFRSTPKLSVFTCFVMALATLGCFLATSMVFQSSGIFNKNYIFKHIDGRVIVTPKDSGQLDEAKLKELAETVGAQRYVAIDGIFDYCQYIYIEHNGNYHGTACIFSYDNSIKPTVGRKPESKNEVLLYIPIEFQPVFGKNEIKKSTLELFGGINGAYTVDVVGIKYYYDNSKTYSSIIMTEEGFENIAYLYRLFGEGDAQAILSSTSGYEFGVDLLIDRTLSYKQTYFTGFDYEELVKELGGAVFDARFENSVYEKSPDGYMEFHMVSTDINGLQLQKEKFTESGDTVKAMYISEELARELATRTAGRYPQSSLLFKNDREAESKLAEIRALGYDAMASSATSNDDLTRIFSIISIAFKLVFWVAILMFIGFFLSVCTGRAIISKMGDIAILRSMGIKVKVVKISLYIQMLIASVPAIVILGISAFIIYTNPVLNPMFPYVYWYQYLIIIAGVVFLSYRITKRNNKKMFSGSVRKTLKSDASQND